MEQMIASWSMVMLHALMAAGPSNLPIYARQWALGMAEPPRAFGTVS